MNEPARCPVCGYTNCLIPLPVSYKQIFEEWDRLYIGGRSFGAPNKNTAELIPDSALPSSKPQ